jgi:HAD superfamily hydrolase (TIGR01509 family)
VSADRVRAVVFDVGETIVDETRAWGEWADWLGIPRLTFFAVLGATIAEAEEHGGASQLLRPGIDLRAETARFRRETGRSWVQAGDLYPDAVPAMRALREAGFRVGVAGNQPFETERVIADLGIELDLIATSAGLGVAKPDPAFFERVAAALDLEPAAIAYVGDRIDNDIVPAAAAGMRAIFIRRGPWAFVQAADEPPAEAAATIDSLLDLPDLLARLG